MKHLALCLATGLAATSMAQGSTCEIGLRPAATLLLPYFEIDLGDPSGVTTLWSVTNASSDATVVHVTLWTDWGIPTVSFDLFLTGFDVATVNLRSVFVDGRLPNTADLAGDPGDVISPHQDHPDWDATIPECSAMLPYGEDPIVRGPLLALLQSAHTGEPWNSDGLCRGARHGDRRARGYLTIDNARACSIDPPTWPGYFSADGEGIASDRNQLWGEYYLVDPAADLAQGESMVHLRVAAEDAGELPATFYGSITGGADRRQPLPDVFAVRQLGGGVFAPGTELLVWRDVGTRSRAPRACDDPPPPLHQGSIYAFDEEESVVSLCAGCPVCSPPGVDYCFPLATQRIGAADLSAFYAPFPFGWTYLDLRVGSSGASGQAWVVARHAADRRFSVGLDAMALHGPCDLDEPQGPYPY